MSSTLFSFEPVILWTDGLIFILLALILSVIVYSSNKEHLRTPWRQIRRRPLAMAAFVVLIFYVSIGLLDSIHFRRPLPATDTSDEIQYDPEVLSLLDTLFGRLRTNVERTYSSPLATHAFTKERVEVAGGSLQRIFPRLKFGGAHLNNPETEWLPDLVATVSEQAFFGLVVYLFLSLVFIFFLSRKYQQCLGAMARAVWRGKTKTAWRSILFTSALIFVVGGIASGVTSRYHIFGTDKVGQDVLYLALKGIRTGLVIGTLTTLVMLPFAIFLGISAGYFRGKMDDAIQYLYTTLSSIPGVLLIAAAILILQVYMDKHAESFSSITERADTRLLFLCLILGMTSWIGLCRMLRGETLKLREMEYVQAARALGVGHLRIITHHILPNVMHLVLIAVVLDFSGLVLAEAVLSYVGVGVDPAMISWGNMINSARLELAREPVVWWSLTAAFIFMFGLVLSANVFSDAVRDAFDPRLRGR